jgi:hypothetical protein
MDIAGLKPIERTIEINNPGTGSPLGIRVRVVSIEDERLKRVKRSITDERFQLERRNKSPKSEDIEANAIRLLWAACLGWEWYNPTGTDGDIGFDAGAAPDFHGEVPEFNERNFKRVCNDLPWFADQITTEIDETKAFFDNSKSN